jgi:hypothetical protein
MKKIGNLLSILFVLPLVFSCTEGIELPKAELEILLSDAAGNEVPTTSVKVGDNVIFRSKHFTDYAVVWPGDRGDVTKKVDGTDSTDIFGNTLYEFSHNYEDYGLDVGGSERKARGINMTTDEDNPDTKSATYSYKSAGTYTVTLVVGNHGRYEVGVEYEEDTRQITVTL